MILKVKRRESGFAMMAKGPLENPELSFKARGIWAYLMSKPEDWQVNMKDLQRGRDGREAVQSGLKELEAVGLAEYKLIPGKGAEWILYEVAPGKRVSRLPGKPVTGKTGDRETRSYTKKDKELRISNTKEQEAPLPINLQTTEFQSAWQEWKQHRKELKKPAYRPLGSQKLLKQLSEWGPDRAVAAINWSIMQSYQGIYECGNSSKQGGGKRNEQTLNANQGSVYAGIG